MKNSDRVNNYNKAGIIDKLKFEGINFPMEIEIYPPLTCKKQVFDKTVNLLYFRQEDKSAESSPETKSGKADPESKTKLKSHYCWIKNLSALLTVNLGCDGNKK